jgi:hypothetical protein
LSWWRVRTIIGTALCSANLILRSSGTGMQRKKRRRL